MSRYWESSLKYFFHSFPVLSLSVYQICSMVVKVVSNLQLFANSSEIIYELYIDNDKPVFITYYCMSTRSTKTLKT